MSTNWHINRNTFFSNTLVFSLQTIKYGFSAANVFTFKVFSRVLWRFFLLLCASRSLYSPSCWDVLENYVRWLCVFGLKKQKPLKKVRENLLAYTFFSLQALNGFIMMTTQTGKLLYISDNAAEYLGHSMVSTFYTFYITPFWCLSLDHENEKDKCDLTTHHGGSIFTRWHFWYLSQCHRWTKGFLAFS